MRSQKRLRHWGRDDRATLLLNTREEEKRMQASSRRLRLAVEPAGATYSEVERVIYRWVRYAIALQSGKEVVLLRLPPLETGRAPLNAPSLSTSRTTQLLFLILF